MLAEGSAVPKPARYYRRIRLEKFFRLTRVTRIFQTSIFTKTTCGSPFRCGRFFDGASARNDRLRPPLVGGAGPSPLKRTASHARTAATDEVGGPSAARSHTLDVDSRSAQVEISFETPAWRCSASCRGPSARTRATTRTSTTPPTKRWPKRSVVRFIRSAVIRTSAHFKSIRICRQQLGRRDVRSRE